MYVADVCMYRYWTDDQANQQRFPLFVSVDGTYQPTLLMATGLRFSANIQVIQNVREATACDGAADGYCWLSHHYRMLLQLFFECLKAPHLIFIEEDLAVAPDFFNYFAAVAPLMDQDSSILCVSAWNDHGQAGRASNNTALLRTDIMPGLGWMLSASLGLEALPGWPGAGWDEYLRDQRFVKGRQCIFPEVARTHTFGEKGASGGIGYKEHLANMVLNKQPVDWAKQVWRQLGPSMHASDVLPCMQHASLHSRSMLPAYGQLWYVQVLIEHVSAWPAVACGLGPCCRHDNIEQMSCMQHAAQHVGQL